MLIIKEFKSDFISFKEIAFPLKADTHDWQKNAFG